MKHEVHEWVSTPSRMKFGRSVGPRRICIHCGISMEFDISIRNWLWSPLTSYNLEGTLDGRIHSDYHTGNIIVHPIFHHMDNKKIPSCKELRMDSAIS